MEELAVLLGAYAAAVDARDLDALRGLFLADATLTVRRGKAEPQVFRGRAELSGVIEALAPFELTLHEVSSAEFAVDPEGAEVSGRSVCVAHHIRRGEGREGSDLVLHGRYSDRFRRDADGAWRFAARELRVLWTEKRAVRPT
ncbi:MAG: nuclear transport factor 2 family protein [Actinobacteria bacterium]|nr:nuclear transport factor 2 family protein [Actinomycetota bacterium]